MKQHRDKFISFRVSAKERRAFTQKAEKFGGLSALLHEFVEAFLEDRMTITPHPEKEKLYVSRIKD